MMQYISMNNVTVYRIENRDLLLDSVKFPVATINRLCPIYQLLFPGEKRNV
jgi:hypothetical protein